MTAAVLDRMRFLRIATGAVGFALLVLVLGIALFGPFFAPYTPTETIGIPFTGPSAEAPLGTDILGRDVLSRVLWGGRSVLALAGLATLIAYLAGGLVGLVAGYSRSLADPVLMRGVDVLISIPALLFILVLITGAGRARRCSWPVSPSCRRPSSRASSARRRSSSPCADSSRPRSRAAREHSRS